MAVKAGFVEAMFGLSPDAAPFLSLLSHADWRSLLRGTGASPPHPLSLSLCVYIYIYIHMSTYI